MPAPIFFRYKGGVFYCSTVVWFFLCIICFIIVVLVLCVLLSVNPFTGLIFTCLSGTLLTLEPLRLLHTFKLTNDYKKSRLAQIFIALRWCVNFINTLFAAKDQFIIYEY